jgi:hypothetical protein
MNPPQTELDALRGEIEAVRGDFEGLARYVKRDVVDRIKDARQDVQILLNKVEETERRGRSHQDALQDLAARLRRMKTSLDRIERRILASGDVEVVDLDAMGTELRGAAGLADAGEVVREQWLSEDGRQMRTDQIAAHDQAVTDARRNARKAIEACADLAALDWDAPSHRAVRARYHKARTDWNQARLRITSSTGAARQAQSELCDDDARRAADAETINAGDQAWTLLITRLPRRSPRPAQGENCYPCGWTPNWGRRPRWARPNAGWTWSPTCSPTGSPTG